MRPVLASTVPPQHWVAVVLRSASPPGSAPKSQNSVMQLPRQYRNGHAGEYGAMRIYEGQLAVLRERRRGSVPRHMPEQ